MHVPKAVLFDLDGTLIDHFGTIQRCLGVAASRAGQRVPTLAEVHGAVGGGIINTMRKLFGEEAAPQVAANYGAVWESTLMEGLVVLPEAAETLAALHARGMRCLIFTNKHGPSSRRIARELGWEPWLHAVLGAEDTPWRKPDAAFSRHALDVAGCRADEAVLVGDSTFDADAASIVGMPFLGVATGTHSPQALLQAGARAVYPTLAGVRAAVCSE